MADASKYIVGVFDDEDVLLPAVKKIRETGVQIHDVYTPYPVHHLDTYLGYKRTRLGKAAFMFGATGTTLAITMISYMLGFDWPMDIGGKDFLPAPNFVPVTFEATVLISALGMVGTFLVSRNLGPGKKAKMFDPRSTDDKHVMAINLDKNTKHSKDEIVAILKEHGVTEEPKEVEL
ncbi:MAG TPA: DUF3341 domain-containing protein [Microscillaceae bacterium]|nr:DUF3341 domain-containing protein [Microscillaceae bacterium]